MFVSHLSNYLLCYNQEIFHAKSGITHRIEMVRDNFGKIGLSVETCSQLAIDFCQQLIRLAGNV